MPIKISLDDLNDNRAIESQLKGQIDSIKELYKNKDKILNTLQNEKFVGRTESEAQILNYNITQNITQESIDDLNNNYFSINNVNIT